MTAASEAVADPDIRAMVLEGFFRTRQGICGSAFGADRRKANCRKSADPFVLAQLASATIHTIAIRARAAPACRARELEAIVKGAIDVMVGKIDLTSSRRRPGPIATSVNCYEGRLPFLPYR